MATPPEGEVVKLGWWWWEARVPVGKPLNGGTVIYGKARTKRGAQKELRRLKGLVKR